MGADNNMNTEFNFPILSYRIIDGDTIKVEMITRVQTLTGIVSFDFPDENWTDLGFDGKQRWNDQTSVITHTSSCRLMNWDTPKTRGDAHREVGRLVTRCLEKRFDEWNLRSPDCKLYAHSYELDTRYGRRFIGDISVRGKSFTDRWSRFIGMYGLGKKQLPSGKRPEWSKEELETVKKNAERYLGD